jgi:prepilin-type N-terminal cleavage/methylation domain-containing protein
MKIKDKKERGFTLIELMVATTIFTSIMLASMGSLFFTLDAARNSRSLRFAMDNVNFAMDSMTRSIRMGSNYTCAVGEDQIYMEQEPPTKDCLDGDGTFIVFIPQDADSKTRIGYRIASRGDAKGTRELQRCDIKGVCVPVVSSQVDVQKLFFTVKGSSIDDKIQPSVYIIMKGTVTVKGVETSFSLQTFASQRNL